MLDNDQQFNTIADIKLFTDDSEEENGLINFHKYYDSLLMYYSHSIVPGGFDVMSYTTLFIPSTSLIILDEIEERTS